MKFENPDWRFTSPGPLPDPVVTRLWSVVVHDIVPQGSQELGCRDRLPVSDLSKQSRLAEGDQIRARRRRRSARGIASSLSLRDWTPAPFQTGSPNGTG
jgi:hypothetical protein